jgi:tetratricopeptide (TPR) repeat protein
MRLAPKIDGRWVLLLPILSFVVGTWYFRSDRSDVKVAMERARDSWRSGAYEEAIEAYSNLQSRNPSSALAPECLWEIATIYYYNLYDISNAMHYFDRVIDEYPRSPLCQQSHLKLAEIFERELNEPNSAVKHWEAALKLGMDSAEEQEVEFRIADAEFKMNELDEAFVGFEQLAQSSDTDHHLAQQSKIRLGILLELSKDYEGAIRQFSGVLGADPCKDCRLQAQLELIECYEALDRLGDAIAAAKNISPEDYPSDKRDELLDRLTAKQRYYGSE